MKQVKIIMIVALIFDMAFGVFFCYDEQKLFSKVLQELGKGGDHDHKIIDYNYNKCHDEHDFEKNDYTAAAFLNLPE